MFFIYIFKGTGSILWGPFLIMRTDKEKYCWQHYVLVLRCKAYSPKCWSINLKKKLNNKDYKHITTTKPCYAAVDSRTRLAKNKHQSRMVI